MPFVQAISGCDTTSPMFGMDLPLFRILNEIRLRKHAMMFMNPNTSQDEIVKSGEEVIVSLYGGIIYEDLNFLRYRKFTRKVSVHTLQVTTVNMLICNYKSGKKQQIITTL
jgi:hypothetical protein